MILKRHKAFKCKINKQIETQSDEQVKYMYKRVCIYKRVINKK